MSDRRPCPRHPENGDVLWMPIIVPAGRQYPGSPERHGEVNSCKDCLREMK